LVGYWTFDGGLTSWATGQTLEISRNGNTGQMIGLSTTTSDAAGKIGQAFNFNGSSEYVDVPLGSSINNLGPLTVSAWIYPSSFSGGGLGRILDKIQSGVGWRFHIFGSAACDGASATNALGFADQNTPSTSYNARCSPGNTIKLNRWQHVVVTWDGTGGSGTSDSNSGVHLYWDGTEVPMA
jgi:hypothetical protein